MLEDIEFWKKMFYVCMFVGIAIFTQFAMSLGRRITKEWKGLGIRIKNDWKKQIEETKIIMDRWKNGRPR